MGRRTYDPETSRGRATEQFKGAEKVPFYAEGKRVDVSSLSRNPEPYSRSLNSENGGNKMEEPGGGIPMRDTFPY